MHHYDHWGWYTKETLLGRETEEKPPSMSVTTTPGKQRANWDGFAWRLLPYAAPVQPDPLGLIKTTLKDAATEQRWKCETGGIALPNGVELKTATDDQARITSVIANARLAGVESVDFKAANGWVTLTLDEVEGIAAAVALHVQRCFATERAHHEAIDALMSLEDAQAYDVWEGWA